MSGRLEGLRVAVVGLGPMGRGIAREFDRAGAAVMAVDASDAATAAGLRALAAEAEADGECHAVAGAGGLAEATGAAEVVVEAVVEDVDVKRRLLSALGADRARVVASNTSSASIAELGRAFGDPARFVGMHFFNPATRMPLVEVVRGPQTSPATVRRAVALAEALGKTPVVCADAPGFLVNRVCRPLYHEAQLLVTQGLEPAAVDAVARGALGHRMGPLQLLDLVGLHTHLAASEIVHRELGDDRYRPIPLVRRLVRAGMTGRAAGRGFYDYDAESPRQAQARVTRLPGRRPGRAIAVAGPGAAALLAHPRVAAAAGDDADLAIYSAPSRAGAADIRRVRELSAEGRRVVVDSSHGGWLAALPPQVGWVRLHVAGDAPFAEVVADAEAGIAVAPAVEAVLDELFAPSVRVLALPGLVADRLAHCLVNEAVAVLEEGTAEAAAIDAALRLGMSHPRGPFEQLERVGRRAVRDGLAALLAGLGDPRYRPAALLSRQAAGEGRA